MMVHPRQMIRTITQVPIANTDTFYETRPSFPDRRSADGKS